MKTLVLLLVAVVALCAAQTATVAPSVAPSVAPPSATSSAAPPAASATSTVAPPPASATSTAAPPASATSTVAPPPASATSTAAPPPASATSTVAPPASATSTVAPPSATSTVAPPASATSTVAPPSAAPTSGVPSAAPTSGVPSAAPTSVVPSAPATPPATPAGTPPVTPTVSPGFTPPVTPSPVATFSPTASPAAPPPVVSATPFPPRVRGINNNPAVDDDIYLCFFTTSTADGAKNVTLELDDQYEISGYEDIPVGLYNVNVTSDDDCTKPLSSNAGPYLIAISGSTLVSYQNDTNFPLIAYSEPFNPATEQNNMTQVFVVVQSLQGGQTGATVSFVPQDDDVSIASAAYRLFSRYFFASPGTNGTVSPSNTAFGVTLDEGSYDLVITSDPAGTSIADTTKDFDGGEYITITVNYNLEYNFEEGSSSSGLGWLLWTVIGIAVVIVLVVLIVGGVIIFRHFKNRSQYDVIGDDATATDDYKFQ